MRIMNLMLFSCLVTLTVNSFASETIFYGEPNVREVSTGEVAPQVIQLTKSEATEYSVSVVEKDGTYYWASREFNEVIPTESGAYITYIAKNGSGYIRVETMTGKYTEHLTQMLSTITYRGEAR